ncbi:hypothetical protein D3C73_1642160 [compost metagenome]
MFFSIWRVASLAVTVAGSADFGSTAARADWLIRLASNEGNSRTERVFFMRSVFRSGVLVGAGRTARHLFYSP